MPFVDVVEPYGTFMHGIISLFRVTYSSSSLSAYLTRLTYPFPTLSFVQFFSLVRRHAQLVSTEATLFAAFEQHCSSYWDEDTR